MANLNKVMLIGNLTRDPELKYLPNQTAVCEVGLAVNRTWTGQDGVKKEETTFIDCTAWSKQAEILTKYRKKGDPIFVEGRLKLDQWDAQDGSKRYKMRVVVENFQFLNRGQPGGYGAAAPTSDPGEYGGEPQPQAAVPARQPDRPQQGRPTPQQPRPAAAAPAGYDPGSDVGNMPEDDAPQIKDEDIPF